jgi:hypothetical protein
MKTKRETTLNAPRRRVSLTPAFTSQPFVSPVQTTGRDEGGRMSSGGISQFSERPHSLLFPQGGRVNERGNGQGMEPRIIDFSTAQNFRELFALLDAKRTLWGSQKCYTAAELKMLINRFRSRNLALHLPLQLIPRTAGLQQRVKDLLEAEILKVATANRGTNGHDPMQ